MNRSVVTHQRTAWWRSHRAPSRWTAGSDRRPGSGRGGNSVAGATVAGRAATLAHLQPGQKTVGQPHRDGVPVEARPEAPLILVPSPVPAGLLMARLDDLPPRGVPGQLFQGSGGRQGTPVELALLQRASAGPLSDPPAHVPLPVTGHAPAAHRHTLLAQPALTALAPAPRAPLPPGYTVAQFISPPHRGGRCPSHRPLEVGPHRPDIPLLPGLQARPHVGGGSLIGLGEHTAMGPPHARA